MRGTVTGSFIYYLLGKNCFNPLPVHYYCPACGHYEEVVTNLFGIDLPEKTCPNCGASILADGFNLPAESVWGMFQRDFHTQSIQPDSGVAGVIPAGYIILPTGNTPKDYPDLLSYLENGDTCISGNLWELEESFLKPIRLLSSKYMDILIQLQRATGIYANEITNKDIRDITWSNIYHTTILDSTANSLFHELKPKTFRDMISIEASSHNSFSWGDIDSITYTKMTSADAFKKYPCFTREDFFDHLIAEGFDRSFAFNVSERIRKGHASNANAFSDKFNTLEIPNELKEVARNYMYIFPRAHAVEYMLTYARISYYAKIDSRAFSKVVFKRKK